MRERRQREGTAIAIVAVTDVRVFFDVTEVRAFFVVN